VATYGHEDAVDDVEGLRVYRIRPFSGTLPGVYQGDRQHAAPFPDPAVVRALGRIIEDFEPDVVHAHNWMVYSLLPLRRRTSAPCVLTLHDFSNVCSTKRYMYMDQVLCSGPSPRRCLRCASNHYRGPVGPLTYLGLSITAHWKSRALDHVLAVSRAVAEGNGLADFGVPWGVVPNFITDELGKEPESRARPDWLPDGVYWLFAGDLSLDKGTGVLLSAYQALPQTRPPLVLVGRQGMDLPESLPAGVVLAGPRPHGEVMAALAGAAVATAPSIWPDPCPTVVLEAMAHGVPMVTTAIGGMVDMVRDGVDGRLVPPGDPERLSEALWALHEDPALARSMGTSARAHVDSFRASAVVGRIEQLYEELVRSELRRKRERRGSAR
jgi:glycogen(starch) synthase